VATDDDGKLRTPSVAVVEARKQAAAARRAADEALAAVTALTGGGTVSGKTGRHLEGTVSEDIEDGRDTGHRSVASRMRVLGLAVLVTAMIVLTVFSVIQLIGDRSDRAAEDRERAMLDAARTQVTALISLNKDNAPTQMRQLIVNSTGEFEKELSGSSTAISDIMSQTSTVAEGTVTDVALEKHVPGGGQVLVVGSSSVSNAAGADEQVRAWRLRAIVVEDSGRYKLSNVEFVL
jgi:Mce-associated membrane protein